MISQYYHTLGVPLNADIEEVKRAFRKLALQHHPDRGGDEEKFKKINEAYQIITNNLGENNGHTSSSKEKYFEIKDISIDQFRSILNILVYFGNIDGDVSEHEKNVIRNFINQYSFKVNLEDFIEKTVSRIAKKDHSDFLNTLYKDLDKLDNLILSDKHKIVTLLNLLVHSDGENTIEEQWILSSVLTYWRIFGEQKNTQHHSKNQGHNPFLFPDKPTLFQNLNITVGNLQKLFEMGYTIVAFSEVFSVFIYSQKKVSSIWLIPPKVYPFNEMIRPTIFTFIFGWWSISGFFFTIASLFKNLIGGEDISNEIAKQNNIKYSSAWAKKNSGGKNFIFILIIGVILGGAMLGDSDYSDTSSGTYLQDSQQKNSITEQSIEDKSSYHIQKCGEGKCELNGTCHTLPQNAICEDEKNIGRKDAWKCINDSIEYKGSCVNSRFDSSTIISKNGAYFNGGHQIKINNQGGSSDALVKIVDENTKKSIITFYVQQGNNFTAKNIRNGTYSIYFKYFSHRDNILKSLGSQKMEQNRFLKSTIQGDYIQFNSWEITIYPVLDGNAQTDSVSDSDFTSM